MMNPQHAAVQQHTARARAKLYVLLAILGAILILSGLALAGVRVPSPAAVVASPTAPLQPRIGPFAAGGNLGAAAGAPTEAAAPTPISTLPVNYVLTADKPVIRLDCGGGQLYKLHFGGVIDNQPHLWIGLNDREVSIPPEPIAGGWIYRGAFGDVMVYDTPPRAELANIPSCPDP